MSWRDKLKKPNASTAGDGRPTLEVMFEHYGVSISHTGKQMVRCPMQPTDGSPSCSIDLNKQLWKCHSCNVGGDVWTLIEKMEGTNFVGAKRFAASAGFSDQADGRRGDSVSSRPAGRRRSGAVSARSRNDRAGGTYVPSWRR